MSKSGTPLEWFWAKVKKTEKCWLWTGHLSHNGYGQWRIHGKHCRAHRFSWELVHGPLAAELHLCHSCDVRNCVNPAHLFPGTAAENIRDKVRKKRQARNASHGMAKLSVRLVTEIRKARCRGVPLRTLAERFDTDSTNVALICKNRTWIDIPYRALCIEAAKVNCLHKSKHIPEAWVK